MSAVISFIGLRTSYGIVDGDMEFKTHAFKAATDVGWLHSEDAVNATTLLGSKLDAPWTFRHILLVFITINLSYTLIILSEWRVFRSLKLLEPSMQASTRRMQSDLHRALIALALCPLFSSFLPTGLLLLAGLLQFQLGTYSAFVTIFMSSITLINPITTCYFVAPFRKAITRLAACKGLSKQTTSSITFLSSTGANQHSHVTS
ncbi:Protein STR-90 [Aphelenchoides avenae]|nr:Protein STR-90 [Aphelenchus avenae]